jgi:RHS repeat-associated protein
MPGSTVGTPATPNKQLYNGGSEWQNDFGNLPDYYQTFNRNYDAAIARFVGVDPAAEGVESLTSYQYAGNNPIMFNDPLGDLIKLPLPQYPANYGSGTGGAADGVDDGGGGSGSEGFGGIPNSDRDDFSEYWDGIMDQSGLTYNTSGTEYEGQNHIIDQLTGEEEISPNYGNTDTYQMLTHTAETLTYDGITNEVDVQRVVGIQNDAGNQVDINQGGGWLSDAWGWVKGHFYYDAEINVTQGSIGGQIGGFAGYEFYTGKHNMVSLSTNSDHSASFESGDDQNRLYGGEGVVPIGDVPVGFSASKNTTTGELNGSIGAGDFGYEKMGNNNFVGLDATKGFGIGIIGLDINLKIGFRW